MEPYQQSAETSRRQGQRFFETGTKALKTAASLGASAAGGLATARILPFLNEYVPFDLMKKGLSHLDKRFGKFIDKALQEGYDENEIKGFIGEKTKKEESPEQAKENRNIIEQYSPELHKFIDQRIKSGEQPLQAGAAATTQKQFGDIIKKLTKEHKTPWSNIIESVYGTGQIAQPQQQAQSSGGLDPQLAQILQGIRGSMQRLSGNNLPVYYDTNE